MFICKECAKEFYIHWADGWFIWREDFFNRFPQSLGVCEAGCQTRTLCVDIPSSRYSHKDSVYTYENILVGEEQ